MPMVSMASEPYHRFANNNLKLTFLLDGGKPMAG